VCSSDLGVFNSVFSTKDQLKFNLINLLLTAKGERVENPNFGTTLRSQLFEQITETTFSNIEDSIRESVQLYIPDIEIVSVNVYQDPNYNTNTLVVNVSYRILISGQTDSVTVNFE
jgi:phage baseplate assembly protein W